MRKWRHMDLMSFQITPIYTLTFWFKQYAYNHGHPNNWGRPWHGYSADPSCPRARKGVPWHGCPGLWWNILHVGSTHAERQPAIWLTSDADGGRMITRVSLENNELGLPCDPPSKTPNGVALHGGRLGRDRRHWTMVALVLTTHGAGDHAQVKVFFDGKKVAECNGDSVSRSSIPGYQERKSNGQENMGGKEKYPWWMDWSGGHKYFWVASPWYRTARIRIGHLNHYPDAVMGDPVVEAEHEIQRQEVENTEVYHEWSRRRRL